MKRKIQILLIINILIISIISCNKIPLTNGDIITETRSLSDFNVINIDNNIDITLIKSDTCMIEITSGENLMKNIISDVCDSSLYVRNENNCNWLRSYDCPLTAKIYYKNDITSINFNSVGDLLSDGYLNHNTVERFDLNLIDGSGYINLTLLCDSIFVTSDEGTSQLKLQGNTEYAYFNWTTYGGIKAEQFQASTMKVYSNSDNDIYVYCTEHLYSYIFKMGNVYYKGNPEIESHISPLARGLLLPLDF